MASNAYVAGLTMRRVIPAGLVLGASMEVFMYYTGFWKVALKNAGERAIDDKEGRQASVQQREKRLSSLGLRSAAGPEGGKSSDGKEEGLR